MEGLLHASYPERIIFKFIRDENAVELQFKQEEIDASASVAPDVMDKLAESELASSNYELAYTDRLSRVIILLNNRPDGINHQKIFDQKKVRQAIAHLIPISEITDSYLNGTVDRINSVVAKSHPDYHHGLKDIEFNPAKAAQLLEEAGWQDMDGDGILDKEIEGKRIALAFKFSYPATLAVLNPIMDRISQEMEKVGIDCEPVQEKKHWCPIK